MKTFQPVLSLVKLDCLYSVKIDEPENPYLKFWFTSRLLKLFVFSNVLSPGPGKLIIILCKLPWAPLRLQEHKVAINIDDIISLQNTFENYQKTVIKTI